MTRFSAAIWGFLVPIIMETVGFQVAAIIMIGFVFVSWLAGSFFGSDARGLTLDEITKKRYGDEVDQDGWFVHADEQQASGARTATH